MRCAPLLGAVVQPLRPGQGLRAEFGAHMSDCGGRLCPPNPLSEPAMCGSAGGCAPSRQFQSSGSGLEYEKLRTEASRRWGRRQPLSCAPRQAIRRRLPSHRGTKLDVAILCLFEAHIATPRTAARRDSPLLGTVCKFVLRSAREKETQTTNAYKGPSTHAVASLLMGG